MIGREKYEFVTSKTDKIILHRCARTVAVDHGPFSYSASRIYGENR